jgi:hypothetical protein
MGSIQIGGLVILLIAAGIVTPAKADNTVVVVVPPDYSYLHNAGKAATENAGQQLGAILGSALRGKQLVRAVLSVRCEHFTQIAKVYSDGTVDISAIDILVDRDQLAVVEAATHGALQVIEQGC